MKVDLGALVDGTLVKFLHEMPHVASRDKLVSDGDLETVSYQILEVLLIYYLRLVSLELIIILLSRLCCRGSLFNEGSELRARDISHIYYHVFTEAVDFSQCLLNRNELLLFAFGPVESLLQCHNKTCSRRLLTSICSILFLLWLQLLSLGCLLKSSSIGRASLHLCITHWCHLNDIADFKVLVVAQENLCGVYAAFVRRSMHIGLLNVDAKSRFELYNQASCIGSLYTRLSHSLRGD